MTIHLATGIICGGSPTYCGAKFEYDNPEGTTDVTIKNATRKPDNATCKVCLGEYRKLEKRYEAQKHKG